MEQAPPLASVAAVGLGALTVNMLVHYWLLWGLAFLTPADNTSKHFRALLAVALLPLIHFAQVVAFAVLYGTLIARGWGGLDGHEASPENLLVASAMAYTTLGFSNAAPIGPLKLVAAMEGLAGFMSLTWSATFIYAAFRNSWRH